jgi:hypothetical protein
MADGVEFAVPLKRAIAPPAGIRRATYDVSADEFQVTLPLGDVVTLDMRGPGRAQPEIRRPVVYLDQLHWISLAQYRWSPEKLRGPDRSAAGELMRLLDVGEASVAFSSANMSEMSQMDGRHRRHLATILLTCSRGWQMRNPLSVRGEELRLAMRGESPRAADVFTLEPGAIFAGGIEEIAAPTDFPEDWRHWFRTATTLNAMVAAMIEDKRDPPTDGMALASTWAEANHRLARYMRDNRIPREHARINSRAWLISDLGEEIVAAASDSGLDQVPLDRWLRDDLERDLRAMPCLGRLREMVHERLRNADDHWEANDLIDVTYLSCAAGYADVVVGEKKHSNYLRRVCGRVSEGAQVFSKLAPAVEYLKA